MKIIDRKHLCTFITLRYQRIMKFPCLVLNFQKIMKFVFGLKLQEIMKFLCLVLNCWSRLY